MYHIRKKRRGRCRREEAENRGCGHAALLPRIWGITGVWLAVPAAEGIMFVVSTICLIHYRKKYSY